MSLLHETKDASPEEDLGVTKTVLLLVQLDQFQDSTSGSLVILSFCDHSSTKNIVSCLEFRVEHLVGEASPADGDTSQHTIALVLVHHQLRLNTTRLLMGVRHNTTDEVGLSLVKSGHEVIKLALEVGGHSLATLALLSFLILGGLSRLAWVVSKALNDQRVGSILQHLYNSVIEGVLVLLQPASQVVGDSGGVVDDTEVSIRVRAGVGLAELGPLAQAVGQQLLSEGQVSGLGEERLLLKDGKETHGLFKHVNAFLQIHAKVDIGPIKTFFDILFLL